MSADDHGKGSTYNLGCRCGLCRAANARRLFEWRAENRKHPVPQAVPHGSVSTYTHYGCRCDPCRAAKATYGRQYRARTAVEQ